MKTRAPETKTVKFLKEDKVHRAGEQPFTYEEGSIHSLRKDRADYRIANGIAVEVKEGEKNDNAVDSAEAVAGKDGGDTGKRPVDESAGGKQGSKK
jgi:hypothetical protein